MNISDCRIIDSTTGGGLKLRSSRATSLHVFHLSMLQPTWFNKEKLYKNTMIAQLDHD